MNRAIEDRLKTGIAGKTYISLSAECDVLLARCQLEQGLDGRPRVRSATAGELLLSGCRQFLEDAGIDPDRVLEEAELINPK